MNMKYTVILSAIITITGCQNSSLQKNIDEEQKIYIHQTTKNYGGLIELYKNRLKTADTQDNRYKLAQTYYLSNDFDSAKRALLPIIEKTNDDNMLVLYGHIESKLGHHKDALVVIDRALAINSKNGEAYNLKGIILIHIKQYDAARYAFNQARDLFYDENKVVNNLAMLSILNREYDDAYAQLNVLYTKGYQNKALLHNLLYTLVKLNQIQLARSFCEEHKLSSNPTILIEELKQIEPIDVVKFNDIVPNLEQKQKQYSFEKIAENQSSLSAISPLTVNIQSKIVSPPTSIKTDKSLNNSNSIERVRSGEHKQFSRITIESINKIDSKDYTINQLSPTSYTITINNVTLPTNSINQITRSILNSNRDFTNVEVTLSTNNMLIIKLNTKHESNSKNFYAGLQAKRGTHCLAFDFYTK